MKTLLVVLLVLVGCADIERAPVPLDIYVSADVSSEHALGVADAASWWGERINGVLKGVTITNGVPPCGTVWVTYGCTAHVAETFPYDGCHAVVRLNASALWDEAKTVRAVEHELGHVLLGDDHDPHPGNVLEQGCTNEMAAKDPAFCYPGRGWSTKPTLTQDQIDRINAKLP